MTKYRYSVCFGKFEEGRQYKLTLEVDVEVNVDNMFFEKPSLEEATKEGKAIAEAMNFNWEYYYCRLIGAL